MPGMRIVIEKSIMPSAHVVKDCTLSFGGMAPITVVARQASNFLIGRYSIINYFYLIRINFYKIRKFNYAIAALFNIFSQLGCSNVASCTVLK